MTCLFKNPLKPPGVTGYRGVSRNGSKVFFNPSRLMTMSRNDQTTDSRDPLPGPVSAGWQQWCGGVAGGKPHCCREGRRAGVTNQSPAWPPSTNRRPGLAWVCHPYWAELGWGPRLGLAAAQSPPQCSGFCTPGHQLGPAQQKLCKILIGGNSESTIGAQTRITSRSKAIIASLTPAPLPGPGWKPSAQI